MPANAPNATESLRQRLKLLWWPLVHRAAVRAGRIRRADRGRPAHGSQQRAPATGQRRHRAGRDRRKKPSRRSTIGRGRAPSRPKMIDAIDRMGAKQIVLDILYTGPSDASRRPCAWPTRSSGRAKSRSVPKPGLARMRASRTRGCRFRCSPNMPTVASVAVRYTLARRGLET